MANKKKKQTREEMLEKKRQAERLRYQRLKKDPVQNAELKEKEKYIKKKEKGLIKLVNDMTEREKRVIRKNWREKIKKFRERRKQKSNLMPVDTKMSTGKQKTNKETYDSEDSASTSAAVPGTSYNLYQSATTYQPEIVPSTSVDYESGSISNSSNFQVKAEPLDIKPEIDYSQYAGIPDHLEDPLIASVKVEADEEDESIEESDYRITTPIVEYHEPDVGLSEWSNESEKNVSNDPPPAKRKKVTKTKEVHCQVATLQPPKEVSHVLTNDEDEYDIFGQHIASQLRLLPTEIALKAQEELRNVILKIRTNYIKEQESIKELRKDEVVRKDVEEEEENINTENINVKNTEENDTDGRKKVSDESNKEMNESVIRRRKTAIRTLSESELRRNEELGIFGKQIAIQLRELPTTIALEVQSEIISSVTKKRIEYLRTQRESSAMSHSASDENVTLLRKSPLAEKVVKNTYAY